MTDPTTNQILQTLSAPASDDEFSVTRRRFLQGVAATGAVASLPYWLGDEAIAGPPLGSSDGVMVLITMGGGNDGLNTVVPISDGAYYDARPGLAIPAQSGLILNDDRALHPNLPTVKRMWDAGNVAVLEGVGQPVNDLSHFSSMGRWMSAIINGAPTSGWLGRYLDGLPGTDPLGAVTIGSSVPLLMQGRRQIATALPNNLNGLFRVEGDAASRDQAAAVAALGDNSVGRSELEVILGAAGKNAIDLAVQVTPGYAATPETGRLARELQICARLINANLGIRVLHVIYGDFDSHSGQPGQHGDRMAELDEGIDVFFETLNQSWESRALVLTASEFGRRVASNDSQGTDHGAAGTLLAVGRNVRGGFYGELPSLTNLTRQGNLIPSVDFRSVYATVLDDWLKADSNAVLGSAHETLGFLVPPGDGTPPTTPPTPVTTVPPPATTTTLAPTTTTTSLVPPTVLTTTTTAAPTPTTMPATTSTMVATTLVSTTASTLMETTVPVPPTTLPTTTSTSTSTPATTPPTTPPTTEAPVSTTVPAPPTTEPSTTTTTTIPEEPDPNDDLDSISIRRQSRQIARLHLAFFGRTPTDSEIEFWLEQRAAGASQLDMADTLAASVEFNERLGQLDDLDFVWAAYRLIIGRRPRSKDARRWARKLMRRRRSRGWLILTFSRSRQFKRRTADIVAAFLRARPIARLHLAYFGVVPDEAQLITWAESDESLRKLSLGFAQSDEFEQSYGDLSASEFVAAVCAEVLERTCDETEAAYWQGIVDDRTRADLMLALSESPEFISRTLAPVG